jgi:hypothetical protein
MLVCTIRTLAVWHLHSRSPSKTSLVGWQGSESATFGWNGAGVEVVSVAQLELRGLSGDAVISAVDQLKASLALGADPAPEALTALTKGKPKAQVFWRPRDGYWALIEPQAAGRFYCAFGMIDPATKTKQPTLCTINVRVTDPWNPMGAFASGASDGKATYYVHWGRNTGRADFASRFGGRRATIRWDDHGGDYFLVAKLGTRQTAKELSEYLTAYARIKSGGALEASYRSEFEQGIAEAIRDLEGRLNGAGGADASGAPQNGPTSGGLGVVRSGDISGSLNASLTATRERLAFLKQLQQKLRLDPYLLATPVERISNSVRADRRRRLLVSIGVTVLSTGVGWLLSSLSPASVLGVGEALYATLVHLLPWLPHM